MRGSIRTVQVKGQNTGWLSMSNIWGAAWEIEQSPQPPLDFRFVDDSGSEVILEADPPGLPHGTTSCICMPQADEMCFFISPHTSAMLLCTVR